MRKVLVSFDLDNVEDRKTLLGIINSVVPSVPLESGKLPVVENEKPVLATVKQKWKMTQLGIDFTNRTTKSEAHRLISEREGG